MDPKPQRPKHRDAALSSLNAAIKLMNLAKGTSNLTVAMAVFGSVGVTLAMIRVGFLLVRPNYVQANVAYAGYDDQQNWLCRARTSLCRCV